MHKPVKVLYIVAKGRSGSNLLAHCLGQLDGWCNTGELYHLWGWGYGAGARCGCGEPVPACPLWSEVLCAEGFAGVDVAAVDGWQRTVLSWKAIPRLLGAGRSGWRALERYVEARRALYRTVADLTGARVIVDASKWPWDPLLLGLVPGVEVAAVHLVRDPRAVAWSWQRQKRWQAHTDRPDEMPRFAAGYSALSWLARNAVTEVMQRHRRRPPWTVIRYEDFMARPREVVTAIAAHASAPAAGPFVGADTLVLEPTHSVGGNPSKFHRGRVRLRIDDEWRTAMPAPARLITTALSAPLLPRYGYPFSASHGGRWRDRHNRGL